MLRAASLALISLAAPAAAREPLLQLPLDCTLGKTCFIQQYTDTDPGPGAADYTCGALSYDGHKGTDFALPFTRIIDSGIDVFAAAPGTVVSVRDGMEDHLQGTEGAPDVSDKECGNGVLVSHGDGWETQYCHLKRGSVRVRKGQSVSNSTPIGQVGLSGKTQFPHLHLSVRHDGQVIDPFNATGTIACGETPEQSLWRDTPVYRPGGLISVGFSDAVPGFDTIKAGHAGTPELAGDAPALVLWAYAFGSREGDTLHLSVAGPGGAVLSETVALERPQAQYFRAVGRRATGAWQPGDYLGVVKLIRDDKTLDEQSITLTVNP